MRISSGRCRPTRRALPDLQNGPSLAHPGRAKRLIQHVGISNFRLPIRFRTRDNGNLTLETSVTGTVSLEGTKKGINMSRIMRSFYAHAEKTFQFPGDRSTRSTTTRPISTARCPDPDAAFPSRCEGRVSLRSGLSGYQYYDIALELLEQDGVRRRRSCISTMSIPRPAPVRWSCRNMPAPGPRPAGHAAFAALGRAAVGGSRLRQPLPVVRRPDRHLPATRRADRDAGDGQARGRTGLCRTERRQPDLSSKTPRGCLPSSCKLDPRIGDFRVVASHQESLHSHDAVSVLTEGDSFDVAKP